MTTQPEAPPPTVVGGYTLLAPLGEGGMGVVHLARRGEGPRVALKVLRPHVIGDQESRDRLAREVDSLERVRSPWVAEILDADPWGETPYVVTRYVPGLSLHDHVKEEGPVHGRDLTWLAGCLAEGLAAVHGAGVLHRDVKPSNVLMEGRTPILIDFGLARVADDPRLTHTGFLIGTPGYLAPEILYGDDASTGSDLHSWAATVAYAATGRPPFGRGPAMAIMDRVRRGQYDLEGFTGPLADVVAAALAPEPEDRPTPAEVLGWLRPQTTQPHDPPVASPVAADDPFTIPLALAGTPRLDGDDPAGHTRVLTDHGPPPVVAPLVAVPPPVRTAPPGFAPPTLGPGPLPPGLARTAPPPPPGPVTAWEQAWDDGLVAPAPQPVPWPERLRRVVLTASGGLVVMGAVAAAPYLAPVLVAVAVWLLRSGSLAASAAAERRAVRGRRWYDGPRTAAAGPWHLVQSLPATLLLIGWGWAAGACAGLLGYAAGLRVPEALLLAGAGLALATWTGPGASRVRGPIGRVVRPASRLVAPWVVALLLVLGLAAGLAAVGAGGSSWWPTDGRPGILARR